MNECESCELELSAAVDGLVDPEGLLPAVDHLLGCSACQRFYRGARLLDAAVAVLPAVPEDRLWQRIAAASAPVAARRSAHRWALRAAAVLAAGLGLWALGTVLPAGVFPSPPGEPIEVRLEEQRGQMSDQRFAHLTAEVLRADRRYQRKMSDILAMVGPATRAGEGTSEGAGRGEETVFEARRVEAPGPGGSDRTAGATQRQLYW